MCSKRSSTNEQEELGARSADTCAVGRAALIEGTRDYISRISLRGLDSSRPPTREGRSPRNDARLGRSRTHRRAHSRRQLLPTTAGNVGNGSPRQRSAPARRPASRRNRVSACEERTSRNARDRVRSVRVEALVAEFGEGTGLEPLRIQLKPYVSATWRVDTRDWVE